MSRYYRVCPGCGANLDPGEICDDCRENERSARAANTDAPPQRKGITNMINFTMNALRAQEEGRA